MAFYYFISNDDEDIICMDAESNINVSRQNRASTSSIMTGAVVTDGFDIGNRTISISGVVTYSKTTRQKVAGNPDPLQFQQRLNQLIKSKKRFTLFSNKQGEVLFEDIDDCIIVNHSVNSKSLNSLECTLTIQEQYITDAARKTVVEGQMSQESKKGMDQRKDQGKGTSTEAKEDEVKDTLLRRILTSDDSLGGVIDDG